MVDRVNVEVYTTALDAEFGPGGQVTSENKRMRQLILLRAIKKAPRRSGELKAAHRDGGALKEGQLRLRGIVYNDSDHALYVHDGTRGPITATDHEFMWVPRAKGMLAKRHGAPPSILFRVGPAFHKKSVRGQTANPWLAEAAEEVLSSY